MKHIRVPVPDDVSQCIAFLRKFGLISDLDLSNILSAVFISTCVTPGDFKRLLLKQYPDGTSLTEIAHSLEINKGTLSGLFKGNRPVTYSLIKRFSEKLDLPINYWTN